MTYFALIPAGKLKISTGLKPLPKSSLRVPGIFSQLLAVLVLGPGFSPGAAAAETAPPPNLARLGSVPDWSRLDPYQGTMTREEFVHLLRHCYARKPEEADPVIRIEPDRALILRQSNHPEAGWYDLRFKTDSPLPAKAPAYWRGPVDLEDLPPNSTRPLEGLRIAIDPGHIGESG